MNQASEENAKAVDEAGGESDMLDKFFFGNDEEGISSKGLNAVGSSGCTNSTMNPPFCFVQTQGMSTCTFTQLTSEEAETLEATPTVEIGAMEKPSIEKAL